MRAAVPAPVTMVLVVGGGLGMDSGATAAVLVAPSHAFSQKSAVPSGTVTADRCRSPLLVPDRHAADELHFESFFSHFQSLFF